MLVNFELLNRILKYIQRDMRHVRRDKRIALMNFQNFTLSQNTKRRLSSRSYLFSRLFQLRKDTLVSWKSCLVRFCVSIKRRTNFFLHVVVVVTAVVSRCVLTVKASTPLWFSRTRRFINVVTSCRRYCRGVSVTAEADAAFLIKRLRCQGSLHCVRI